MTTSQVAETLKSQGFKTEVLGDDTVLVSLNRKISTMEIQAALSGYSVQSANGKVKVYIQAKGEMLPSDRKIAIGNKLVEALIVRLKVSYPETNKILREGQTEVMNNEEVVLYNEWKAISLPTFKRDTRSDAEVRQDTTARLYAEQIREDRNEQQIKGE